MSAFSNSESNSARKSQSLYDRLQQAGDEDSWNDFFNAYRNLIFSAALKKGLNEIEAAEVVQDTFIGVFRAIPKFVYNQKIGTFERWLLAITYRRIQDKFRKRRISDGRTFVAQDELVNLASQEMNPSQLFEASWDGKWRRNLMALAIEAIKKKVKAKDFQVFELAVLQELPSSKIQDLLRISGPKICLIKHRVSNHFKKEIKRLQETYKSFP